MNIFEEKKIKVADAVLALDLDGTLTNSKKQVTENTKAAIDRFIDAGGTVVLASGRPTFGVMPVAKTLELDKRAVIYFHITAVVSWIVRIMSNFL